MNPNRIRGCSVLIFLAFWPLAQTQAGQEGSQGLFIAVGHGAHRLASEDGLTWGHHQFVGKPGHNHNDLAAMTAGNGLCLAVGGFARSHILYTRDGIEWKTGQYNIGVLGGALFRGGKFLIFSQNGRVASSPDAENWTILGNAYVRSHIREEARQLGLDKPIKSNVRIWREAGGVFLGSGDNGLRVWTRDFKQWHFHRTSLRRVWPKMESDGKVFVVAGDIVEWSTNAADWTVAELPGLETPLPQKKFRSLVHDGKRFLLSYGQQAWQSPDGKTWTLLDGVTLPGFVATPRRDRWYSFENYWKHTRKLLVSTDQGKTWKEAKLPAPAGITHILYLEDFSRPQTSGQAGR